MEKELEAVRKQALAQVRRFAEAAIEKAIEAGFAPSPILDTEANAVELLKTGLPLAAADPKFSKLLS